MLNARLVVRTHLFRERLDVLIAVIVPFILMSVSGYANAWIFSGGHLDLGTADGWIALIRGVFLEGLIYAAFKIAKIFCSKGWRYVPAALVLIIVGSIGMVVSAGCNLGWETHSGEMAMVMQMVNQYMPGFFADVFKIGLGLLFPVAVGVLALFDVSHVVEEMLQSGHLDEKALKVSRSEMHRTAYLKAQKRQQKNVQSQYDQICEVDAQKQVDKARAGDLSFGADDITKPVAQPGTKITPIQQTNYSSSLPVAPVARQLPAPSVPAAPAPSLADLQTGMMPSAQFPKMPPPPGQAGGASPLLPPLPLQQQR